MVLLNLYLKPAEENLHCFSANYLLGASHVTHPATHSQCDISTGCPKSCSGHSNAADSEKHMKTADHSKYSGCQTVKYSACTDFP